MNEALSDPCDNDDGNDNDDNGDNDDPKMVTMTMMMMVMIVCVRLSASLCGLSPPRCSSQIPHRPLPQFTDQSQSNK